MEVRKVKYTAERFMEEVQKYECLYNKYSKDFKDRNKKIRCIVIQFHDLSQSDAVNTEADAALKMIGSNSSRVWLAPRKIFRTTPIFIRGNTLSQYFPFSKALGVRKGLTEISYFQNLLC